MQPHKRLLLNNQAWVTEKLELRTNYFRKMLKGQSPAGLWIGCSDSRVPAEEITCAQPGELFVHRNIANIFHPNDQSAMSVVQYAVQVLQVEFIVICGHFGCGGALASIQPSGMETVDRWLDPIRGSKDVQNLPKLANPTKASMNRRANEVARLNVIEGVKRLEQTEIIQSAWAKKGLPRLLGWMYNTFEGSLAELIEIHPVKGITQQIEPAAVTMARS